MPDSQTFVSPPMFVAPGEVVYCRVLNIGSQTRHVAAHAWNPETGQEEEEGTIADLETNRDTHIGIQAPDLRRYFFKIVTDPGNREDFRITVEIYETGNHFARAVMVVA